MLRCHFCVAHWVDRATDLAGVALADLARRRLIAGLLSRPHLILSGPRDTGKEPLARALALSGVDGQMERVCWLQGHPWWAADTADVGRFVELQTDFSLWRLAEFADSARNNGSEIWPASVYASRSRAALHEKPGQDSGEAVGVCRHVVCVERMSPVEVELYFRVVARWLVQHGESGPLPIRLVGTYDSRLPPTLDEPIGQLAALVHLDRAGQRDVHGPRPANERPESRLLTSL